MIPFLRRAAFLVSVCLALPLAAAEPSKEACACMPKPVLPVALSAMESNQGWSLSLKLPPFAVYTDIFLRFDDQPEISTGHDDSLDVMTGKPEVRRWIMLPASWVTPGEHTVAVRMVRPDGTVDGPHKLRFDPGDASLAAAKGLLETMGGSMISFAEHGDEVTWLMLTSLFSMEDDLKEIRYSVDDCSLGQRIVIGAPESPDRPSADRPYVTLPKKTTRSACAQVVFRDGTVSKVMKIER
ncbi:MAG: hypothetical protein QOH06_2139 [Acidobacteriota bacterium]|jgi:hypothetical protein|nr:hypothetical protein [Acidobacteriota bacterium]